MSKEPCKPLHHHHRTSTPMPCPVIRLEWCVVWPCLQGYQVVLQMCVYYSTWMNGRGTSRVTSWAERLQGGSSGYTLGRAYLAISRQAVTPSSNVRGDGAIDHFPHLHFWDLVELQIQNLHYRVCGDFRRSRDGLDQKHSSLGSDLVSIQIQGSERAVGLQHLACQYWRKRVP